jgi:transcriptional regulator NrdR
MRCEMSHAGQGFTTGRRSRGDPAAAVLPGLRGRFTTYERVQLRDLVVIKSNGKREDFDRDKLERSIRISMQKRPVEPERIDQMISGIVRRLESMGETDIPSKTIGEIVMERLAAIDTVAYVRFASVYKNFQATDDFEDFLKRTGPARAQDRRLTACLGTTRAGCALALSLGARGLGRVWPNPAVGCVMVKDGRVVGRGWTQPGGRPHAEAHALAQARDAARGATAYVTLEPCSHHGQTPPCAGALIDAGVARVVMALGDPDPRVNGQGIALLRDAGIAVVTGVLEGAARVAQAGFLSRVSRAARW